MGVLINPNIQFSLLYFCGVFLVCMQSFRIPGFIVLELWRRCTDVHPQTHIDIYLCRLSFSLSRPWYFYQSSFLKYWCPFSCFYLLNKHTKSRQTMKDRTLIVVFNLLCLHLYVCAHEGRGLSSARKSAQNKWNVAWDQVWSSHQLRKSPFY